MSKRITSLLFGALTAMLLSVPAQAQDTKQAFSKAPKGAIFEIVKHSKQKPTEDELVRKLGAERNAEVAEFLKNQEAIEFEKAKAEVLKHWEGANIFPSTAAKLKDIQSSLRHAVKPVNAPHYAVEETVDDYGVIIEPAEGETKMYKRSGGSIYASGSSIYGADQSGKAEMVECADGTIYIKDFLYEVTTGAWVKGTIEGNTITIPTGQMLYFSESGGYGLYLARAQVEVSAEGGMGVELEGDITLTIDGDVISLNDAEGFIDWSIPAWVDGGKAVGAFWTDDNSFSWYADDNTVFTYYDPSYEPVIETGDPVELPFVCGFDSEDDFAQFGVYDANEDGSTWIYGEGIARYRYSGSNEGDDWLVAPAVYLEAGKNYHFALDAWAQLTSYPERIEVLMGTEAKVSALKQQVIEPTDVVTAEAVTLENEAVKVEESGYYFFGIHAISDADEYYLNIDNLLIEVGADPTAPAAVTDFTVVSFQSDVIGAIVKFKAPTVSINGAALTENIAKVVLYRDGAEIKTFENVAPGTMITYVDQAEDLTLGTHTYQVIPFTADGPGQKSEVVEVFLTCVLSVPYIADFSDPATFALFNVIDANGDNSTWSYSTSSNAAMYGYSSSNAADDYLITLPVQLKAGKSYAVNVNAWVQSASYPEVFEVLIGKEASVEGLTQTIIEPTEIVSTTAEDYTADFTVSEDGNYFVAVHAISEANMWNLFVGSIAVEAGLTEASPAAPRISVQPDPYGAHKAVVTVTAPGYNMGGQRLTENMSKLNILRDGVVIKSYDNVAPEDIKVYVDENIEGAHTYQAIPFDANDDMGKKSEKVKTYVGLDVPAAVENVVAQETVNGAIVTWDPVTTGANGGVVVPNEIKYEVWTAHIEVYWMFEYFVLDDLLATTTDTKAEVELDQTGEQDLSYLLVLSKNQLGGLDETYANPATVFQGVPYAMPFEEHFGSDLAYSWPLDYSDYYSVEWAMTADSSDGNDGAITITASAPDQWVALYTGKIAMREGNPTVIVDVKGTNSANKFKVIARGASGHTATIGLVRPTNSYQTLKASLADFTNEEFVIITLYCEMNAAGSMTFDNVKVSDMLEHNLTVSIDAPKSIKAGETAKVNVAVKNQGENAASNFVVKVMADEKELLNETVTEPLASFATKTFAVDFVTTIFDDAADVTLSAEAIYDVDLDDEDNLAETVISIKQSTAAAPENVTGEKTENGVKLSWSAPSNSTETITEDFDDVSVFETFSVGGIDADNQYGAFGDWTAYDGNNMTVYGFQNYTWPHAFEVQAWQVMDPAQAGIDANYPAASGTQYMISMCPVDAQGAPAADHWLISPELPGVAQTISFKVRELVTDYGAETYEIWVSTSDNKVESFTKVASKSCSVVEWSEESFDLPEGSTYFAIRHTSTDVFGLLIDDVTFTRGGGSVESYNIWVDGELAESVPARRTSIELPGASTSSVFAVSAVYANGAESKPVVFVFSSANQEMTAIQTITGSAEPADIYTLDGKLVRQQATDLSGLKGVYIINGQKVVIK